MRILVLMALILSHLHVAAQSISISVKDTPLKTVLETISRQARYNIDFKSQNLADAGLVTYTFSNVPLATALELLLTNQPVKFSLENNTIIITDRAVAPPEPKVYSVRGRVLDELAKPLPGASVTALKTGITIITDTSGEFRLANLAEDDVLEATYVGYLPGKLKISVNGLMEMQLVRADNPLEIVVATGYQKIAGPKMTGSFVFIDSAQFNRRISTNFMDRLENMSTGVLFSKNQGTGSIAGTQIIIRGISTIYGTKHPLIVIDNFPYDGDLNNINPNDIENVTILKDAAATGLWGAYAGNGVIVVTTKKGKFEQAPKVSLTSNLTISAKPDLNYLPLMSSADYMEVQDFLYRKGYYNSKIAIPHATVPPDVMILDSVQKNLLSAAEADIKLAALRGNDLRSDLSRYLYQKSINQQYAINIHGGGKQMRYYFSAGYDKNRSSLVRNFYERITVNANNVYLLLKEKLELTAGVGFTQSTTANNNNGSVLNAQPYTALVDENGKPAAVETDYRQGFKNIAGNGSLLDWNYVPLDDLKYSDNVTKLTDYRVNIGAEFKVLTGLSLSARYQYGKGVSDQEDYKSQDMYYPRHLINKFSQIDGNGSVIRPVPLGGIMDLNSFDYTSHNGRLQLDYNTIFNNIHNVSITSGIERRSLKTQRKASREYGYNPETQRGLPVDYATEFPLFATPFLPDRIPNDNNFTLGTIDNYLSYYSNFMYTLRSRYNLSVNLRKDESNLFGSRINQRGTPLWSVGVGWLISRENFYHVGWLPELRFRATHGYTGNIDKTISPYTVVKYANTLNSYNALQAFVANPANRKLQWERVRITNFAVDFVSFKNRISGTIEFYLKNSSDLIGIQPVDQTTGVPSYRGNTADMTGKGVDFTLNMRFIENKNWKWFGTFLYSYVSNKVTGYDDTSKAVSLYVTQIELNPVNGTPLESIYAYGWAGLNPENGNPRGYLNKEMTEDYAAIFNSRDHSNIFYMGPATPKFFGSYRNTITYKNFDFSFLIQYKLGHFFRNSSINYSSLFPGADLGHTDYARRWQKPGDELITNVPSISYPADKDRDNLYIYSEALVEKADHIRLQDVQLGYTLSKNEMKRLPFQSITLNVYINNVGLLWKATDSKLDPEFLKDMYRTPLTGAVGLKVNF